MANDWLLYFLVLGVGAVVMMRLDRIGKQIEAVHRSIIYELAAPDRVRQSELLAEWQETKKEAAKDARQFWIFWVIVAVVGLVWAGIKR